MYFPNNMFPKRWSSDVDEVTAYLTHPLEYHSHVISTFTLDGEPLGLVSRIYGSEPSSDVWKSFNRQQQIIAACIYTRHENGFVRETYLKELAENIEPPVIPFVIQLLGEYVFDISKLIVERSYLTETPALTNFVKENPAFIHQTFDRAVSYWNCYYRKTGMKMMDYPGVRILKSFFSY